MSFEMRVGARRRITLPSEFRVEEGQNLMAHITEKGNLYLVPIKNASEKIRLFACPIGIYNNRYYGVVMDSNGVIGARVNSSNRDFLIQDLTIPKNKNLDKKLNSKFGEGNWNRPEYIDERNMPNATIIQTMQLQRDLRDGIWPPRND